MSLENPLSILYNSEGLELAVSQSQALTGSGVQPGLLMFGSSSTGNAIPWRAATDGAMFVTGTVNASFSPSANTPVSQGLAGGISDAWNIKITDGTQVLGTGSSAPVWVSGAVTVAGTVNVGNFPTVQAVSVSNFPAVQTVTGTITAQINQVVSVSNGGPIGSTSDRIWITGSVTTSFDPSTSATVTPVSSSTSSVTLQAANGNRRGLTVYNDSSKILFLKLGSAASTTDFSVKISSQGYFEVPSNYTNIVTGIWSGVNGFAYVTEILD
jgi:hypothetical protein